MNNNKFMYHYTNNEGWEGIQKGQIGYVIEHPLTRKFVESETVKGWVIPHRRLIPVGIESSLVPTEAISPAIFGLPEPTPQSWLEYKDCISVWDYLLSCCRKGKSNLVLLRLEISDMDNPKVFDYIHVRKTARDLSIIKDPKEYRKKLAEGNRDYWNSGVELKSYNGSFVLPEVVVFSPIPIERVEFVKEIENK